MSAKFARVSSRHANSTHQNVWPAPPSFYFSTSKVKFNVDRSGRASLLAQLTFVVKSTTETEGDKVSGQGSVCPHCSTPATTLFTSKQWIVDITFPDISGWILLFYMELKGLYPPRHPPDATATRFTRGSRHNKIESFRGIKHAPLCAENVGIPSTEIRW